jgi:hypothetical protein
MGRVRRGSRAIGAVISSARTQDFRGDFTFQFRG